MIGKVNYWALVAYFSGRLFTYIFFATIKKREMYVKKNIVR